jgi:hypothetical protein
MGFIEHFLSCDATDAIQDYGEELTATPLMGRNIGEKRKKEKLPRNMDTRMK